jgi:LysR family glycine cleavage system transcriptional activator
MLDRRTLPLQALRAFEMAARHLHLGRAGAALGVTHGAISHQLRSLEARLGVRLFDRAHNSLRLTSEGQLFYQTVRAAFDQIIEGSLHLDPDSLSGALTIACTPTIAASWALGLVCAFQAQYPQMSVEVIEIQPREKRIPEAADIALCYGRPDPDERRVETLMTPALFPVASQRLTAALPLGRTTLRAIAELPLLEDSQNSWQSWFKTMDIAPPVKPRVVRFFSTALCIDAARRGYGVALANPLEMADDLREGTLVRLTEKAVPEAQAYYLVAAPEERQPLRARLFESHLKSAVQTALALP